MASVKLYKDKSSPVQVRFGIDVPRPGGVRPDIDSAALGQGDFVYLKNIRRIGTSVLGRPGSGGGHSLQLDGEPTGIGDLQIQALRGLMMVADGCPGESSAIGFSLMSYNEEQVDSPPGLLRPPSRFLPLVYRPTATVLRSVRFKRAVSIDGLIPAVDSVFFAVDNVLYRLAEIPFPYQTAPLGQTNGSQEIPVWTIPAPYASIGEMLQFGDSIYISVLGGLGASAIFAYDGLTFTRVLDAVDPITGFAVFRNMLIAGHNGTTNLIRIWSGGVWRTLAPGAGTVKLKGNRCASYHDTLFIPSDDNIFSFDGITTLTRIAPGTTGVDVGSEIFGLESCFDSLFATWTTALPKSRLLKYDGTTWTATHKDFVTQFADCVAVRALRYFHGALMVGGVTPFTGSRLYRSDRRTTSGVYTELIPQTGPFAVNAADIRELIRYGN